MLSCARPTSSMFATQLFILVALVLACCVPLLAQPLAQQQDVDSTKTIAIADISNSAVKAFVVFLQKESTHPTTVYFQALAGLTNSSLGYLYHVHQNPIENENCATAGGHFDPFGTSVNDVYKAPPTKGDLQTYQVGDLSGKPKLVVGFDHRVRVTDRRW
jgi:Cu/Zn superoxide dismutase